MKHHHNRSKSRLYELFHSFSDQPPPQRLFQIIITVTPKLLRDICVGVDHKTAISIQRNILLPIRKLESCQNQTNNSSQLHIQPKSRQEFIDSNFRFVFKSSVDRPPPPCFGKEFWQVVFKAKFSVVYRNTHFLT